MKKLFLMFVCGCLLLVSLAGCGSIDPSENTTESQTTEESVTETVKETVEVHVKDHVMFGNTEWIVLSVENDKIFLISKYCQAKGDFSKENDSSCAWENSRIRTWLNNEFYSKTFSADEQAAILETNVMNLRGENTTDRLYLLDEEEFNQYLSEDERATGYSDEGNAWWWLRSPGGNEKTVACVNDNGTVLQIVKAYNQNGIQHGVRPVMWVSKDAALKPVEEEPEAPALYTEEEFMEMITSPSFTEADLIHLKTDLPEKLTTSKLKEVIVGDWKTGSFDDEGNFVFSDELSEFHADGTARILGHDDYHWVVKNDELIINDDLKIEFRKAAENCYWCYFVTDNIVAVYIKDLNQ